MRKLLFVLTLSTLLIACAKPYKYLGRAYVPTPVVKLYFREADVVEPYEVMGKLDVALPSNMNMNKIQSKVMAIARSKGADALIIDNFDQTTGGFVTTGVGATSSGDNGNVSGSKRRTDIKKDIVVKASLLKYKEKYSAIKKYRGLRELIQEVL
jgi:hypothetical protein